MLLQLMLGVSRFERQLFEEMQPLFKQLSHHQNPHILLVTCCDSRIDTSLMTQSKPGDLFVIRNVGNIIPPNEIQSSEAAAIEYALKTLPITDIIVCGHSDCGAMKALLIPTVNKTLPCVSSWINHARPVLTQMSKDNPGQLDNFSQELDIVTKKNLLTQLSHLKTYPVVEEKINAKTLTLQAWFYQFEQGKFFVYEQTTHDFMPLHYVLTKEIAKRRDQIVRETAMRYLLTLSSPNTANDYCKLIQLLSKLESNLHAIWLFIRPTIAQRLLSELGNLYTDINDVAFINIINLGVEVKLDTLSVLQEPIRKSVGYHQFMHQSSFFKPKNVMTVTHSCDEYQKKIIHKNGYLPLSKL